MKVACVACGKKIFGARASCAKCTKCKNNAFVALPGGQRECDEARASKPEMHVLETRASKPAVELCSLQQFTRAGKRGMYEYFGVCKASDLDLNFTHRTAHGGDGDNEAVQGKFERLAQ